MVQEGIIDFDEEQVRKAVTDAWEKYSNLKIPLDKHKDIANEITDDVFKELMKLKKPFKYGVTVWCQQKNGSAMNYGGAVLMEDDSDGSFSALFEDSQYIDVMINVVGFRITQKP